MTNQVQVYNPPYCQCRVFKDRGGEVHIVTDGCPLCNPSVPADALVRSLPMKRDEDKWREYEAAAERITTPRAIFTRIPLEIPEVDDLYRGRYGNR